MMADRHEEVEANLRQPLQVANNLFNQTVAAHEQLEESLRQQLAAAQAKVALLREACERCRQEIIRPQYANGIQTFTLHNGEEGSSMSPDYLRLRQLNLIMIDALGATR